MYDTKVMGRYVMNSLKIMTALWLMLEITACEGRKNGVEAKDMDTIIVEVEKPEVMFPDTVFPSVDNMSYSVDVADTTVAGALESLADLYADSAQSLTFRKNLCRNADFGGRVHGVPTDIVVDWSFETDMDTRETAYGTWGGGSGWTGQPLFVTWPDSCVRRFRQEGVVNEHFGKREIIVGSLASRVYFLNFETGLPTRDTVFVTNPIKGTMSLDPTLNGNLYVGLGVPAERPFGLRVIDLHKHAVSYKYTEDYKAGRHWDAYDSSPARVGRFLFWPGENGTFYKFLVQEGALKQHSALRYRVSGAAPGIENSVAVCRNYAYFGDNHGNVVCVNLNTMTPVWLYRLGDDIDATITVVPEQGHPYVYASCEVDRQGSGCANFVKLDGLNGIEVWKQQIPARRFSIGKKHFDGGYYASPLPGVGNCSHLIFTNIVLNDSVKGQFQRQNGEFLAFNRTSGKIAFRKPLKHYAWSSPVGFVNEKDEMFVVTGDCCGRMYIFNGFTGEQLVCKQIGLNFESSPVVVGNSMVVGSRGNVIYKLSLK